MLMVRIGRTGFAMWAVAALAGCAFFNAVTVSHSADPSSNQPGGGLTVIVTTMGETEAKAIAELEKDKNDNSSLNDSFVALANAIPSPCLTRPSDSHPTRLLAGIDDVLVGFAITAVTNEINTAITNYASGVQAKFTPPAQPVVVNLPGLLSGGEPIVSCVVVAEHRASPSASVASDPSVGEAGNVANSSDVASGTTVLSDANLMKDWDFVAVLELVPTGGLSKPPAYKFVPIYYNLAQSTALTVPPKTNSARGQVTMTMEIAISGITSKGASLISDPKITLSKVPLGSCSKVNYTVSSIASKADTTDPEPCTTAAGTATTNPGIAARMIAAQSPWFAIPDPKSSGGCSSSPVSASDPSGLDMSSLTCVSFPATFTVTLTQAGSGAPDFTTAKSEISTFTGDLNTLLNDYSKK